MKACNVQLLPLLAALQLPYHCFSFNIRPMRSSDALLSSKSAASCGHQYRPPSLLAASSSAEHTSTYGSGMDQNDMMENDMLIVVDEMDRAIPNVSASKKQAHGFNIDTPRGIAHRAFSVFLFNERNELLLTQRAKSKITFPGVWTNTCCSHPLHGMIPDEADSDDAFPSFPGIKHAAIRKLKHELGISPQDVPHENFHFLTRFHYWAADTFTYGKEAPWGEHEIDYVLFIKCEGEGPALEVDPEEVNRYKYVTPDELRSMMEDPQLLWSPWFRGIMEKGGFAWWEDLDEALKVEGSKYVDRTIHFFDPSDEHMGSYNLPSHGRDTGVLQHKEVASA